MKLPALLLALPLAAAHAASVWIEGESAVKSTMHRHPWWYDKVKKGRPLGRRLDLKLRQGIW
jgi:hypothetical protein